MVSSYSLKEIVLSFFFFQSYNRKLLKNKNGKYTVSLFTEMSKKERTDLVIASD